jgi:F-type H+-transporting ATPase subunit b
MIKPLLLTILVSGVVYAAGGEEGHHSPLELFWKGFNILLFLGVVYWFGRNYIAEAFNNFWKSLTRGVDESEEELRKAKEELSKAKEELEKAKVRADESIALAKESAQSEIENARKHAEEVAQRIREKAKETVEIELKKAKEELALYGMLKAEEIAKGMLEEAFKDPKVQERYIERQLRALEERKDA